MKKDEVVTISRSEFFNITSEEIAKFATIMQKDGDTALAFMMIDLLTTLTAKIAIKMFIKEDK